VLHDTWQFGASRKTMHASSNLPCHKCSNWLKENENFVPELVFDVVAHEGDQGEAIGDEESFFGS
jgi:hypothetical protein